MKGYKQTDIGIIPCDWDVKRLEEIADVKTGPFGSTLHQKDYVTDGTPIITVEHLGELGVVHENLPMVSDFDKIRLSSYSLQTGDIVFSRVGSVDRNSLISEKENGWLFSGRLLRIRVELKNNDSAYLSYYFHQEPTKQRIRNVAVGQTMASLNTQILKSIELSLPPTKAEQTAIATALKDADSYIDSLEKLIAKKRDIKQGAMQELLKPKAGWEMKTMGQIAELYQPVTISQEQFIDDGYLVYGANGIVGKYGKYNHELWQTTITCRGSTCGTVNKTIDKCWITGNAMVANVDKNTSIDKLFFYFLLTRQDFLSCITGSGQPQIVRKPLSEFELIFPKEKSEQTIIAQILSDMDAEIEALEKKLEKAKQIKQGMMQQLLTGKIRLI